MINGARRNDATTRAGDAGAEDVHSLTPETCVVRRERSNQSPQDPGNANKLIADKLSITEETVKGHVKNILSKLGANDRTHAVTIGLKRGIIEL
jgi:DNA-binding NarL/FixJ family response regulator